MKVFMKDGDVMYGTLAFYNYDEQVIHLEDYEVYRKDEFVEKGKFWVINTHAWDNLSVEEV